MKARRTYASSPLLSSTFETTRLVSCRLVSMSDFHFHFHFRIPPSPFPLPIRHSVFRDDPFPFPLPLPYDESGKMPCRCRRTIITRRLQSTSSRRRRTQNAEHVTSTRLDREHVGEGGDEPLGDGEPELHVALLENAVHLRVAHETIITVHHICYTYRTRLLLYNYYCTSHLLHVQNSIP